ncbi:glycosyltransferase [Anderseniella sp. Alg231-50]|uniref:glycosyltransferase n=1 Tax=Anderseniella sp. Alg231-50 TaxID=1922226 RepID=UPI000D54E6B8
MKVSAIVAAWNAADTLHETLDSIAAQTVKPDEVIVVDDGSTDDTAKVVAEHPHKIQLIQTENRGVPSALNTGIAASTGDAIAILDADDLWEVDKTRLQIAALNSDPAIGVVVGHYDTFECPSIPPERFATLSYVKGGRPGYLNGCLLIRRRWVASEEFKFDETLRNAHLVEWFRNARVGGIVEKIIPETVMKRRIRPGTLGARKVSGAEDSMSPYVLEVARRAIAQKHKKRGNPV